MEEMKLVVMEEPEFENRAKSKLMASLGYFGL